MMKLPHERLLETAEVNIPDSVLKVLFRRSDKKGLEPGTLDKFKNTFCINTTDKRLWLTDENGIAFEYELKYIGNNDE